MNKKAAAKIASPPSVAARVASLPDLTMAEIKALWRQFFASEPLAGNRRFLERRIAHRLQEIEFRKEDPALLDRNQRRIEAIIASEGVKKKDGELRLLPGMVLTREYLGVEHRVTVTQDGKFDYQGRLYGSLSKIAREITGTQWSGPVFFGTRRVAKEKNGGGK